jgi:hypothetical protein
LAARYLLQQRPRCHRGPDEAGHYAEQRAAGQRQREGGKSLLRRSSPLGLIARSLPHDRTCRASGRTRGQAAGSMACISGRIDAMAKTANKPESTTQNTLR